MGSSCLGCQCGALSSSLPWSLHGSGDGIKLAVELVSFFPNLVCRAREGSNHDSLISFFTRFITDEIDYLYGLVFAGSCAALVVIVFFFVIESKDRTLEEIDSMYVSKVNPIRSGKYVVGGRFSGDESKIQHDEQRNDSEAVAATEESLPREA